MKRTWIILLFLAFPMIAWTDECIEGDFKFGKRTGQGTMTYPDGRKYIGEFKDGEWSGQGTLIYSDGKKVSGEFKDGEFVGGQ